MTETTRWNVQVHREPDGTHNAVFRGDGHRAEARAVFAPGMLEAIVDASGLAEFEPAPGMFEQIPATSLGDAIPVFVNGEQLYRRRQS
jgi:hypothetical protein